MKNLASLLLVSILGGVLTLGSYVTFFQEEPAFFEEQPAIPEYVPTNFSAESTSTNPNFTKAAEKTVHAVVHVKNIAVRRSPFRGVKDGMALQGAGSGVIVSPDGYIVTNNHVIQNASKLQVTLNNNKNYMAEVIGTDPKSDIAVLKIDPEKELHYLPFGDSDHVQIGEWVLAVGNPFNLTSTVTAGIVSAKARDLGMDSDVSSFIQTDAAINPGNSGGALVNTSGELIGINTAITSQTGSYVGYAFAVPSNNARKIVQDILEYGDVKRGILGIIPGRLSGQEDIGVTQGVYVAEVEAGSGAEKGGIRIGDIINKIDDLSIRKISDLTGYINSKRPNDIVTVQVLRDGDEKILKVRLTEYETFQIKAIGLEVTNASEQDLAQNNVRNGVKITRGLTPQMQAEELEGTIITEIDNQSVNNVDDVERIMNKKDPSDPISVTFVAPTGKEQTFVWR